MQMVFIWDVFLIHSRTVKLLESKVKLFLISLWIFFFQFCVLSAEIIDFEKKSVLHSNFNILQIVLKQMEIKVFLEIKIKKLLQYYHKNGFFNFSYTL